MTMAEPRTDRPAMDDPTTAALFRAQRKDGIVVVCVGVLSPLCGWCVLFVGDDRYVTPLMILFGVISLYVAARIRLWVRWSRPGGRLLRAEAWRPVAARVVRAGKSWWDSDVRLDDGTTLRVTQLTAAHHALIARTGRVWVVGPDDSGWAAVRVDGARGALPARRIRSVEGSPPVAGDVTVLAAAHLRARSFVPVWILVGWLPWTAWWIASGGGWSILGSLIGWAVVAFGTRGTLLDRHLPKFVACAEWSPFTVTLRPWGGGQGGHTKATGRVWFDDGTSSPLSLPNASLELLAAAHDAESLWFSETPEPGKTLAVGFPGYPLLAVAKISSVRT